MEYRDCEYGNYADMNNDYNWTDDFFPRNAECDKARDKYNEAMYEIVDEIAHDFGLDSSEWEELDYSMFKEMVGL